MRRTLQSGTAQKRTVGQNQKSESSQNEDEDHTTVWVRATTMKRRTLPRQFATGCTCATHLQSDISSTNWHLHRRTAHFNISQLHSHGLTGGEVFPKRRSCAALGVLSCLDVLVSKHAAAVLDLLSSIALLHPGPLVWRHRTLLHLGHRNLLDLLGYDALRRRHQRGHGRCVR